MLVRSPAALGALYGDGNKLFSLALSPDGHTLATGDGNGTVILFDTQTRERIGEYQAEGLVTWLGFHPRDGSLAIVTKDPSGERAYVHIIDATTQRLRRSIPLGGYPADPGSLYIPVCDLRPGRTELDRRLPQRRRGWAYSCAGSTSAAARRWGDPYV